MSCGIIVALLSHVKACWGPEARRHMTSSLQLGQKAKLSKHCCVVSLTEQQCRCHL
jgi:hypothetical protein